MDEENIPWIGESNFLLSSLCRPLQKGVYEVEPCVREVLLEELEDKFGWRRPFELAEFLWFYLDKQGERKPSGELRMVQEWIAQAYLDPDRTIREMESSLSESLPILTFWIFLDDCLNFNSNIIDSKTRTIFN